MILPMPARKYASAGTFFCANQVHLLMITVRPGYPNLSLGPRVAHLHTAATQPNSWPQNIEAQPLLHAAPNICTLASSNIVTLASFRAPSELFRLAFAFAELCCPPYRWLTFVDVLFSSREDQDRSESRFPKFKGLLFA